jgi:hypothetical protein
VRRRRRLQRLLVGAPRRHGLFSSWGGVRAAYCTLIAGSSIWLIGTHALELEHPYLVALASAIVTYLVVALTERRPQLGPELA